MAAQIYEVPDGIVVPSPLKYSRKEYTKLEKEYIDKVKALAKLRSKDDADEVGKVLSFAVNDGYAQYVIMSMKPLELIHLEHLDAYEFQYIDLMTPKKVREELKRKEALDKLFSSK
jgi:hypothetical protein